MSDVVDLALVQANALHQIDLNLVSSGKAADQIGATEAAMLGNRQDRRNVVARMRIVGGEESIVIVQLAHGDTIGPCGPLRRNSPDCIASNPRMAAPAR